MPGTEKAALAEFSVTHSLKDADAYTLRHCPCGDESANLFKTFREWLYSYRSIFDAVYCKNKPAVEVKIPGLVLLCDVQILA